MFMDHVHEPGLVTTSLSSLLILSSPPVPSTPAHPSVSLLGSAVFVMVSQLLSSLSRPPQVWPSTVSGSSCVFVCVCVCELTPMSGYACLTMVYS